MSRRFYEIMQRFMLETIWERYAFAPFTKDTMLMVKNDIKKKIVELFPDFYLHAKIIGREIRISRLLFEKYAATMQFLPCMLNVKDGYFYDLYIDNVPVGTITFTTNADPSYGYGYIVTVDPFERCEFIRNAFAPIVETEEITELPEIPSADKVKIAMNYETMRRQRNGEND